jgi:putative NADPH-quinone reductase
MALALTPALDPVCSDGAVDWYVADALPGGVVYAYAEDGSGPGQEYLVSCSAGRAVEAYRTGGVRIYFEDIVRDMAESAQRFSFADVVTRAKEAGWTARQINFDSGSCICGQ